MIISQVLDIVYKMIISQVLDIYMYIFSGQFHMLNMAPNWKQSVQAWLKLYTYTFWFWKESLVFCNLSYFSYSPLYLLYLFRKNLVCCYLYYGCLPGRKTDWLTYMSWRVICRYEESESTNHHHHPPLISCQHSSSTTFH